MPALVLDLLLAALFGILADFAWFFLLICASGDSGLSAVFDYFLGLVPCFLLGLLLGAIRNWKLRTVPARIGWALSLLVSPPVLFLFNPAHTYHPSVEAAIEIAIILIILALFFSIELLGMHLGVRLMSARRKHSPHSRNQEQNPL